MAASRPGDTPATPDLPTRFRPAELPRRKPLSFALKPDAEHCAALAEELELLGLRKLRFEGTLSPAGREDWDLDASLGATVVQPCVSTLAPVTTRIDEDVQRRFRTRLPDDDTTGEIEMPEDDTLEPLPEAIDLEAVLAEALTLALPPYPRAADAAPDQTVFTEPGKAPMTDEDARPFAGLAGLKDRLQGGGPGDTDDD